MGKVRIIGGVYRSRWLPFNDNVNGLRPTPDRVRETLFNWLGQDLSGKSCLDLFSGSGALGFEAISRNAQQVVMVENSLQVAKSLTANKNLLKINNLEIYVNDALVYLKNCQSKFDVIFLDPPYASGLLAKVLALIKVRHDLINDGIIYIEYQNSVAAPPPDLSDYQIIKSGKAGVVNYALLRLIKYQEDEVNN